MTHKTLFFLLGLIGFLICGNGLSAHCQVPCGIYDDHARVKSLLEDADTVIKASIQLENLSGKSDAQSINQLVRWIDNKELHAQSIIETICDYFLTQRVKPQDADYQQRLSNHHAVIIAAMKSKQNASQAHAQKLKESIEALLEYYPALTITHKY